MEGPAEGAQELIITMTAVAVVGETAAAHPLQPRAPQWLEVAEIAMLVSVEVLAAQLPVQQV